jgi:hypothetical protein
VVTKRQVWDIKGMTTEELRALVHCCNDEEQRLPAPHRKARHGWVKLRTQAEDEIVRREANA